MIVILIVCILLLAIIATLFFLFKEKSNTALSTKLSEKYNKSTEAQLTNQDNAKNNIALSTELPNKPQLDTIIQLGIERNLYQQIWHSIENRFSPYIDYSATHGHFKDDKYALNFHKLQLIKESSDLGERDLIIGLDFGSSTTKVVIRDTSTNKTYGIKFHEFKENPYLKSTCIFIDNTFNFSQGDKLDNLKINLINKQDYYLEYTIAYFALIFRYARYYFLTKYKNIYQSSKLVWRINIGLPAKNCDNVILKEDFKLAVLSGWNASIKKGDITKQSVSEALLRSKQIYNNSDDGLHPESVEVLPEVIAEIVGYAKSPLRNEGLHLLIDIGAMTTDIATFNLFYDRHSREDMYPIFSAQVEHLGVYELLNNLLFEITNKIINESSLDESDKEKMQQEVIKYVNKIDTNSFEYLKSKFNNITNNKVIDKFKEQIGNVFNNTWQKRISNFDKDALKNRKFCFLFICGGGSQIAVYKDAVDDYSSELQRNLRLYGFSSQSLSLPRNFEAPDLPPNSFHRMAVAYGLSFPPEEIGKVIPPSEIDDIENPVAIQRENDGGNYAR